MPRKPAENYHQSRGRRHLGLSYPERFGLTYEAVVILIDSGKWKAFYQRFKRHNGKIPGCHCKNCKIPKMRDIKFISLNGDLICENCVEKIKELARNATTKSR